MDEVTLQTIYNCTGNLCYHIWSLKFLLPTQIEIHSFKWVTKYINTYGKVAKTRLQECRYLLTTLYWVVYWMCMYWYFVELYNKDWCRKWWTVNWICALNFLQIKYFHFFRSIIIWNSPGLKIEEYLHFEDWTKRSFFDSSPSNSQILGHSFWKKKNISIPDWTFFWILEAYGN